MSEKKPVRVLMILTTKMGFDGITKFVCNTVEKIDARQVHMDILTTAGIDLEFLRKWKYAENATVISINRQCALLKYMIELYRILRKGDYQIVHINGSSCTIAVELFFAMLCGIKVRIAHSHNSSCKYLVLHRVLRPLFEISCTNRFACGDKAGRWLFHKKPFTILNNGIQVKQFTYDKEARMRVRKECGFMSNDIVIGHVGYFEEVKNQGYLLELLRSLNHSDKCYRLLLIGQGSMLKRFREMMMFDNCTEYVKIIETTNKVYEYLSAMDVYMMPSLFEGFPITLLEAQASGLDIFASDNISKETNVTGCILFCDLNSPKQWIKGLSEVDLSRREARSKLMSCKLIQSGFDIETSAKELQSNYIKMLESR